jgi:phage terminase small subunit
VGKNDKLTPKQQLFVKEYLIDLNATQAAIKAGYSEKTAEVIGFENLRKPKIQAEIQAAMDQRAERTKITADYVLNTIHETVERCRQAYPVLDRKGNQVYAETPDGEMLPAYAFDSKGVLKGCELLGKHLKLFTEKHEHTGADGGPIVVKIVDDIDDQD